MVGMGANRQTERGAQTRSPYQTEPNPDNNDSDRTMYSQPATRRLDQRRRCGPFSWVRHEPRWTAPKPQMWKPHSVSATCRRRDKLGTGRARKEAARAKAAARVMSWRSWHGKSWRVVTVQSVRIEYTVQGCEDPERNRPSERTNPNRSTAW